MRPRQSKPVFATVLVLLLGEFGLAATQAHKYRIEFAVELGGYSKRTFEPAMAAGLNQLRASALASYDFKASVSDAFGIPGRESGLDGD